MRILALESSARTCRIAALTGATPLAELETDTSQRSAQSLIPGIRALLDRVNWSPQQLELIVVTQGPGSFTGLRIGVMTAKTLAYATGAQILGVNTLEAVAVQANELPVWAVLDGQRQQLFAAKYRANPAQPASLAGTTQVVDIDGWLASLTPDAVISGPGLVRIRSQLPERVRMVDQQRWTVRATTVGQLGLLHYEQGRRDDVWQMLPNYFRQSAAEEKLE